MVFKRGETAYGLFRLNNANAALRYVTVKDGKTWTNNSASGGIQRAGGVNVQSGVVEDCIVSGSIGQGYGHAGIGIYLESGRVSRCRITAGRSNNTTEDGTGVYVAGGVMEDSLIDSNTCGDSGAVFVSGSGTIVNCTVVGNTGANHAGVRVSSVNSKVINCAIYGNFASQSVAGCVYTSAYPECYVNCASDVPIDGGVNCVSSTRAFADWNGGDYRPAAGSPCIDAGTGRSAYGAVSTTDLAGEQRVVGTVDIGCFENQQVAADVGFTWTADGNLAPSTVSVSADSFGIENPEYEWTLRNTVTGTDVQGTGGTASFGDLTAGVYEITVSAGGKSWTSPDVHHVAPSVLFVEHGNPDAAYPYGDQETAAADIATALSAAADGSTIYVAPGVYPISEQLILDKGVQVIGTGHGCESTVVSNTVRSGVHRVFVLQHADALVANMTLTHGYASGSYDGGDAYIYAVGGTISNCLFTCGFVQGNYQQSGGAAALSGGLVTHCEATRCNAVPSNKDGSAGRVFLMSGNARVSNCLIHDCDSTDVSLGTKTYVGKGQLVSMSGGTLFDNNTIVDCVVPGSGNVISGATNASYEKCSRVVNCAFFNNVDQNGDIANPYKANNVWGAHWSVSVRNCAAETEIGEVLAKAEQNLKAGEHYAATDCVVTTAADAFADFDGGDLHPVKDGPIFNAGSNDLAVLPQTDFAGRRRVYKDVVDIGCYEFNPQDGTLISLK